MSSTPESPLKFDCPACGAVLTVPASIAGMQGPCPKCWQEIISPDPAIGQLARLPAPPPAPAPIPKPEPTAEPIATAPSPEPPPVREIPSSLSSDTGETTLSADELADLTSIPTPRRRSKALMTLGIGMPLLALAALGYHFGKDLMPNIVGPSAPISPPRKQPPAAPPSSSPETKPAPTPDETGQGTQPPPAPEASEAHNAQEALIAFLGAPDWQARSAFVISPDEVRPAMEKYAEEHGDGPIPASAVHLNEDQSTPPIFVFKVSTKAMPSGFPVPVTLTDEGPKIDWESFIAFNDDHFQKLLVGPNDQTGILNLFVKPEDSEEPSPHWVRYRLSVPMPGREATAWVSKDSVAQARLRAVFDGSGGYSKEIVDQLVSEQGIPLRLAIMKRGTADNREFIEVKDIAAVGWAPSNR